MSVLCQSNVRLIGGFGGRAVGAYVYRPDSVEALRRIIVEAGDAGRNVALRGAGRSYGDAATLAEEVVVDCQGLNRLEVDPKTGIATAECGTTIEDLWRAGLPKGWWPPVVPGTMHPTLGGALAMNIHGKNDFRKGTLGDHVLKLEFVDGEGRSHSIAGSDPLAREVISSAGLLGAIARVELQLTRVESGLLDVRPLPCRNWEEQFASFDANLDGADYMVSWIDAYASGVQEGRGLFHAATHVREPLPKSLDPTSQELPTRLAGILPKSEAWRVLRLFQSSTGMRFLNAMKHLSGRLGGTKPYRQSLVEFSFLLDYAPDWERAYGDAGFIQYQCFVPATVAKSTFAKLLGLQRESGRISSLSVMKRHRGQPYVFAHGVDGYSLAMDFQIGSDWNGLQNLCWRMNDVVLDHGGRFYLAKDSTLRPDDVRRYLGESALERFHHAKALLDPRHVFQTALGRRLEL